LNLQESRRSRDANGNLRQSSKSGAKVLATSNYDQSADDGLVEVERIWEPGTKKHLKYVKTSKRTEYDDKAPGVLGLNQSLELANYQTKIKPNKRSSGEMWEVERVELSPLRDPRRTNKYTSSNNYRLIEVKQSEYPVDSSLSQSLDRSKSHKKRSYKEIR
jgi:hypothetical protein